MNTDTDEALIQKLLQQSIPPVAPVAPEPVAPRRKKKIQSNLPTTQEKFAWDIEGLESKARVTTSFGMLPVEGLRVRDELRTSTGRFFACAMDRQVAPRFRFPVPPPGCKTPAHPFRGRKGRNADRRCRYVTCAAGGTVRPFGTRYAADAGKTSRAGHTVLSARVRDLLHVPLR